MASTKKYLEFILEQLSELDEITYKAMMGPNSFRLLDELIRKRPEGACFNRTLDLIFLLI